MKYRKRPVEVEAIQCGGRTAWRDVAEWCGGVVVRDGRVNVGLVIHTLEGDMRADAGDYIIRGVQGEFYPCKPDIFEATYEPVGERDTSARAMLDERSSR